MNKFKKIGLSALAASLVSVSANAEVSISGGAGLTFTGGGDHVSGNGWGMNDALDFTWGGELDNGFTVDLAFKLDNSDGAAAQIFDNRTLAIGMGDAGTLTFWGQAGSGVVGSYDDKMPTAYEESFDGADGPGRGHSSSNMFYYTNNSVEGVAIDVSYTPSGGDSHKEGSMEFGVAVTAIEGLTLGFVSGEDKSGGTGAEIDNTIAYITYAFGPVTVGYQEAHIDMGTKAGTDETTQAWGIAFAVNDDLSVSYGEREVEYGHDSAAHVTEEGEGIAIAYTMGSMKIAGNTNEVSNNGGTSGTSDEMTEIALSFAF